LEAVRCSWPERNPGTHVISNGTLVVAFGFTFILTAVEDSNVKSGARRSQGRAWASDETTAYDARLCEGNVLHERAASRARGLLKITTNTEGKGVKA
jgi:hypothetical protein